MIINVTFDDIQKGNASLGACPITIALRREFKNEKISVSRNFIRVPKKRGKDWKLLSLPEVVREFILNYHMYNSILPFSFMLSKKTVDVLKG
jgi:hypothetical protein